MTFSTIFCIKFGAQFSQKSLPTKSLHGFTVEITVKQISKNLEK